MVVVRIGCAAAIPSTQARRRGSAALGAYAQGDAERRPERAGGLPMTPRRPAGGGERESAPTRQTSSHAGDRSERPATGISSPTRVGRRPRREATRRGCPSPTRRPVAGPTTTIRRNRSSRLYFASMFVGSARIAASNVAAARRSARRRLRPRHSWPTQDPEQVAGAGCLPRRAAVDRLGQRELRLGAAAGRDPVVNACGGSAARANARSPRRSASRLRAPSERRRRESPGSHVDAARPSPARRRRAPGTHVVREREARRARARLRRRRGRRAARVMPASRQRPACEHKRSERERDDDGQEREPNGTAHDRRGRRARRGAPPARTTRSPARAAG